jgi:hypothetical protein
MQWPQDTDYPFWYIVAIVLSFPHRFTTSDYPFCILWPLYCLSPPRFTTSDYPFGILWPLYCLSFLDFVLSVILRKDRQYNGLKIPKG